MPELAAELAAITGPKVEPAALARGFSRTGYNPPLATPLSSPKLRLAAPLARFADRHGLGKAQLGKAQLGKAQRPFARQGGQDQRCSLASDRRPAIGHLGGRFAPAENQNSFTAAKYGFG